MKNTKNTILVPTDFTQVAGYALQHAVRVSGVVGGPITLLHIVPSADMVPMAQEKITNLANETNAKYGILPSTLVRVGSIFVDIARVVEEVNAGLVIMGSQSIKEMDESNVSWALKVITSSKAPFVTIQEPPINKRYDDVVFPIDFTHENKEKHTWISYFSDYYLSRFHLIKPNVTDPELLAKVDMNMASALKYLDEKGARYFVSTVPGIKKYEEEVLDLAVNIRADLIVLMTTPVPSSGKYLVEPHEQYIIANARHIPVMSINPR